MTICIRKIIRPLSSAIGVVLLAGCAITPRVDYHALNERPHPDAWVLFRLTDSVIVVGAPPRAGAEADKGGAAPPVDLGGEAVACKADGCGALAAAAAPTDFEGVLFALEPRSRNLIETRLTPTYQSNSLRLKVLSVEAKDHRLEAVNTIGAIAVGAAKATARSGEKDTEIVEAPSRLKLRVPFTIDLAEARCEAEAATGCVSAVVADPAGAGAGVPQPLPENPGWTYAIRFLDNPRGSGLTPRSNLADVHGAMVGAICRPMRLDLTPAGAKEPLVSLRLLVADPDWLETAPFPTKGALTFTGLCGLDVQADAVTTVGTDALATAFFNNVAAIRAAQKK